jgi:hypothetical protein
MSKTPVPPTAPQPTPDVVIQDTRPVAKNPWPRTILLLGILASITTCGVAAQYAPGAKPLHPVEAEVAAQAKTHTPKKHHRPVVRKPTPVTGWDVQTSTVRNPVAVATPTHEAVNGKTPLPY